MKLLRQAGYDKQKTKYLVDGFTYRFSLGYQGPKKVNKTAKNLMLRVGDKFDLWNSHERSERQ